MAAPCRRAGRVPTERALAGNGFCTSLGLSISNLGGHMAVCCCVMVCNMLGDLVGFLNPAAWRLSQ